ncbi:MAG: hypothetical protein NVSMB2_26080 [Chloroflexota bacterium]
MAASYTLKPGEYAVVSELPQCDYHALRRRSATARYDFVGRSGQWGHACRPCYQANRATPSLGTGKGQRLFLAEEISTDSPPRILNPRGMEPHA